jgi:hypothetical protein
MHFNRHHAWTAIPADTRGVTRPRQAVSFSELYRGTEYDSHLEAPARPVDRGSNRGRTFVLLAGAALACCGVATCFALLG